MSCNKFHSINCVLDALKNIAVKAQFSVICETIGFT